MGVQGAGRVLLELNPGEPISGTIGRWSEAPESFRGWIELASKLERLRASEAAVPPPVAPRG
jgi:hypothetical protein